MLLNLEIYESGVINILILILILIFVGYDFIQIKLKQRQENIIQNIDIAKKKLTKANRRLSEVQKHFSQIKIIITQIKKETLTIKKSLLNSNFSSVSQTIKLKFAKASLVVNNQQQQFYTNVKQETIALILINTTLNLQKDLTIQKHENLINKSILKLKKI
jgi:F0F1-type ATP synthase membrane subunit b/b'